jgi:FHS family L-fucose permease-like MFS transporter
MSQSSRQAYFVAESAAVETPYLVLGVVVSLLALLIKATRFELVSEPQAAPGPDHVTWRRLIRRKAMHLQWPRSFSMSALRSVSGAI